MNYLMMFVMSAVGVTAGPLLRGAIFRYSAAGDGARQRCPHCHVPVRDRTRARQSGRLPMSGRCPACRARIGPVAGTVELPAAAVLAVIGWQFSDAFNAVAVAWVALLGVALVIIDLKAHRLPNRLVFAALAGAVPMLAASAIVHGELWRFGVAALCALATAAAYLILSIGPHGFGIGDVKLALVTGFLAGWYGASAAIAAFVGALFLLWVAAVAALLRRRARPSHIPHGPFMIVSMLSAVFIAS